MAPVDLAVVGAVLVGGRSSRMGRDKSVLEIGGVAMAQRVARALREAGCTPVIAIGPAHLSGGLDHIDDRAPGEGPLGGILTALGRGGGAAVMIVACDLAWLDAASLSALLDANDSDAQVVVARTDRLEPLCALWRPTALDIVQRAFDNGERAVHRVLAGMTIVEVPVAAGALVNVNSPDDLPSE
jgi:molybdopterin-guanine dinucleotide biosynthesis protein A